MTLVFSQTPEVEERAAVASTPPSIRVLIAEDEANLGFILEQFLSTRGFAVTLVRNGRLALDRLQSESFDVALLDVVMPEVDGLEVLRQLRESPLPPEIIIITGNGAIETALGAMKLGAYDFLSKPYRMAEVETLVRRAWEKRLLTRNNVALNARLRKVDAPVRFETAFAPLRAVLSLLQRITQLDTPILITGKAGSGKGTLAREIHAMGTRSNEPFVSFDCAAHGDTIASVLLGHDREQPGAVAGLLDVAGWGVLHLEHVHALSVSAQEALLEAITTGNLRSPAHARRGAVNARVVATTDRSNAHLAAGMNAELLRVLSTTHVELPTLRERAIDLPLLAERILGAMSMASTRTLSPRALSALEAYAWPGNIRELRAVLECAALRSNDVIEPEHLMLDGQAIASSNSEGTSAGESLTIEQLERQHIARVLERNAWHQGKAAEQLGISPKTLYRKIREYGFRRPGTRTE